MRGWRACERSDAAIRFQQESSATMAAKQALEELGDQLRWRARIEVSRGCDKHQWHVGCNLVLIMRCLLCLVRCCIERSAQGRVGQTLVAGCLLACRVFLLGVLRGGRFGHVAQGVQRRALLSKQQERGEANDEEAIQHCKPERIRVVILSVQQCCM